MKRHLKFAAVALVIVALWTAVLRGYSPVPLSDNALWVVWALPWYLLMVFGCYALYSLGVDFMNFTDITPASRELAKQIKEAKTYMREQGFQFSS